jgi:hypothetical protein
VLFWTISLLERIGGSSRYDHRMSPLRVIGVLVTLFGLALAISPTLVHDPGPAADTFAAIERRVWWGALAGVGALLVTRTQLQPWHVTLAYVVMWLCAGFLAARLIGFVLDGADSLMQWVWVAVEIAIVVVGAIYIRRKRTPVTASV